MPKRNSPEIHIKIRIVLNQYAQGRITLDEAEEQILKIVEGED